VIRDDERRLAAMVGRRLVEERHMVDVLRDGLTALASAPLFTIEQRIAYLHVYARPLAPGRELPLACH
jgi:hypothetical protein